MTTETNRAEEQARAQLSGVCEMVAALEVDYESKDEARERIQENALSVQMRSGWHSLGEALEPEEFMILLFTGGPGVRIVGDLYRGTPSRPRLEYQDWGTAWTELVSIEPHERQALETYCAACLLDCSAANSTNR